jgi:ABC-type dipeptide/oligopeptide/nickel transport system permease subunit
MGLSATEIADAPPAGATEVKAVAGRSPTQIALERLRKDKLAVVCAAVVLILLVLALLAPVISNSLGLVADASNAESLDPAEVLESDGYPAIGPPFYGFTWEHPLGIAPQTAVDNLAVLLYGLRTSLGVAFAATVCSTVVGVSLGLVAGFSRGWLDRILSFIIDLLLSFPFILGALAMTPILISRFGNDLESLARAQVIALISILVVFGWMGLARLIRGQVLSLREREFVQAAQVIGVPTRRILFKELLPNLVAPIVVATSLAMPGYVAAEAGLSFLGLGLSGVPSLGRTIDDATTYYDLYPLYLWTPVVAVALLVLALNLLGDSVRDAFDPRTRR